MCLAGAMGACNPKKKNSVVSRAIWYEKKSRLTPLRWKKKSDFLVSCWIYQDQMFRNVMTCFSAMFRCKWLFIQNPSPPPLCRGPSSLVLSVLLVFFPSSKFNLRRHFSTAKALLSFFFMFEYLLYAHKPFTGHLAESWIQHFSLSAKFLKG